MANRTLMCRRSACSPSRSKPSSRTNCHQTSRARPQSSRGASRSAIGYELCAKPTVSSSTKLCHRDSETAASLDWTILRCEEISPVNTVVYERLAHNGIVVAQEGRLSTQTQLTKQILWQKY